MQRMLASFLLCGFAASTSAAEKPNIVVVLADDLGWGDPQSYQPESKIPTPSIDRLAAEGMRFTDAHSPSSVCTPTRYTLLTGRYSWRTWLKNGVLDGFGPPLIGPEQDTVAKLLRRTGYRTAAVGKWHLGMEWRDLDGAPMGRRAGRFRPGDDVDYTRELRGGPLDVGFDTYFGISASLDMSPYVFLRNRSVTAVPNEPVADRHDSIFLGLSAGVGAPGFTMEGVLPALAEESERVIAAAARDPRPFFLYMPLTAPHLPIAPTPEDEGSSRAGRYGDFVTAVDRALGRVLRALDQAGVADNTLVLFTSDNGGLWHSWAFRAADDGGAAPSTARGQYVADFDHRSNAQWRGTKADIFEGGHRVPFLVRYPGFVKPGQVSRALVELTDIYATLAELTGAKPAPSSGDGFSLLPALRGEEPTRRFAVHHSARGLFAIRQGNWKFVEGRGSGGFTVPRTMDVQPGDPAGQLYDLGKNPRETRNFYTDRPAIVAELTRLLDEIRSTSAQSAAQ